MSYLHYYLNIIDRKLETNNWSVIFISRPSPWHSSPQPADSRSFTLPLYLHLTLSCLWILTFLREWIEAQLELIIYLFRPLFGPFFFGHLPFSTSMSRWPFITPRLINISLVVDLLAVCFHDRRLLTLTIFRVAGGHSWAAQTEKQQIKLDADPS
jgi:hypothetical protein